MKPLVLLLCLAPVCLWAQEIKKVKLKVYNAECIPGLSNPSLVEVHLYSMPEDTLAFRSSQRETTGEITDTAFLPPGKYVARYRSIVDQPLEKEITLGQRDTAIGFCIDSLTAYPLNTLTRFKEKDSLVLTCSYAGCFGGGEERIVIRYRHNVFTASKFILSDEQYESVNEGGDIVRKPKYNLVQTVQMNAEQKEIFRRVENELIVVNFVNGGTGSVSYSISSPYFNISKGDEATYWGGYRNLSESLFGREEEPRR